MNEGDPWTIPLLILGIIYWIWMIRKINKK